MKQVGHNRFLAEFLLVESSAWFMELWGRNNYTTFTQNVNKVLTVHAKPCSCFHLATSSCICVLLSLTVYCTLSNSKWQGWWHKNHSLSFLHFCWLLGAYPLPFPSSSRKTSRLQGTTKKGKWTLFQSSRHKRYGCRGTSLL